MKFDNASPIYLQVVREIKKEIVTGKIKPGDKLPSGRELAVQYVINPNTAARVYQVLESEGVSYTKRGLGTFVVEEEDLVHRLKQEMADESISTFLQRMHDLGYDNAEIVEMILKGN